VTGRSFLHLGWGDDGRLPGPYRGRGFYIAPEIGEVEATPRSDVFSIGCTLWMAACNEYPFTSSTLEIRRPYRGPRELELLLSAATMHSPGDRPSLDELRERLEALSR
jgi:serine/threonine protein kinase